ncbi:MAG: penicillin acylase family protein [Cyclobacteriaceae bacterium]
MSYRPYFIQVIAIVALIFISGSCQERKAVGPILPGLHAPVEVLRDSWGVNHIYAQNQRDLFFAQGYCAAKDRLFQFEIWRRQATGTLSEILGHRELKRDIGTRLFKYRGNMKDELNYYHSEGEEIINAFVDGVNAYIQQIIATPDSLPIEFQLLSIKPEKWTPEVVISRHQGLLGNITQELNIGQAVAKVGPDKVQQLQWFHPKEPQLSLDPSIDGALLKSEILALYNAFRKPVRFEPNDLLVPKTEPQQQLTNTNQAQLDDVLSLGSNNWVVQGNLTQSGHTTMANDPHRRIAVPSLRYMAHLVAPGWNVIGGGEPEIPGISIGHNDYGAWGLTVFRTDGEDLYVYDLNPENLNQYKYLDGWVDMSVVQETLKVKNSPDETVALRYTRHGPVTYIDSINFKAYAVRCAWLEPGGSPYLASLRMDQAKNWEEFRSACNYSHIPGENMIWADKEGNIGWQAVGIAPIRRNWSGLVPVPGDGRYEWDGYLPITDKPHLINPQESYFATANQNVTPTDYDHWDAIGFSWSDPYRGQRVNEVLKSTEKLSMKDMQKLQTDYFSIPASVLVPYLQSIDVKPDLPDQAKKLLMDWDFVLEANSIAAAIYVAWENQIILQATEQFVPLEVSHLLSLQLTKIMTWLQTPDQKFGNDPLRGRDLFLKASFEKAISNMVEKLGPDLNTWQYGQEGYKHIYITHPLGEIVDETLKKKLNLGPLPRGGNAYTPGSTGSNDNQSSGASFRIIVNTGDWDKAMGSNTPGQSGNPDSKYYNNLFEMWADDQYFPLYYSKEKIMQVTDERTLLQPEL